MQGDDEDLGGNRLSKTAELTALSGCGGHCVPEPGTAVGIREKVVPRASAALRGPVGVRDIAGFGEILSCPQLCGSGPQSQVSTLLTSNREPPGPQMLRETMEDARVQEGHPGAGWGREERGEDRMWGQEQRRPPPWEPVSQGSGEKGNWRSPGSICSDSEDKGAGGLGDPRPRHPGWRGHLRAPAR